MSIDKKELEKLQPEDRIKRLKHLEEQRKKDVAEIETLIKEYEKQIRTRKLADEIAPNQKPVIIADLFEVHAFNELENTARQEMPRFSGKSVQYLAVQSYSDYSTLKEFYGIVSVGMRLSDEQLVAIGEIGERLNIAEKYMTDSEKTASKLDSNRVLLYKLMKETGLS